MKFIVKGHKDEFESVIGTDNNIVDGWNINNILKFDLNLIQWDKIKVIEKKPEIDQNMINFMAELKTAKTIKQIKQIVQKFNIAKPVWEKIMGGLTVI